MAKKYYHNITKKDFNVTDVTDLIDAYSEGDLIVQTEAGNALVSEVTEQELTELINKAHDL